MESKKLTHRHVVIADVHGDFAKLMRLIRNLYKKGFRLKGTHNVLVQLGDRVDRGPDSYRVNNFFLKLEKMYPSQIILLNGNHEGMMKEAANHPEHDTIFYYNGGDKTLASYAKQTKVYGKNQLYQSIMKAGHWDLINDGKLYYMTDKYFFSHAPIPNMYFRKGIALLAPDAFLNCRDTLTWSYVSPNTETWVDKDPMEGRISVSGHIHGLYLGDDGDYHSPGVRKYGNAILLDTGCGCHYNGRLTALILPDMITIDDTGVESNGLKYK